MTKKVRFFPSSYKKKIFDEQYGIECRYSDDNSAILYLGNSARHTFHYHFRSAEAMFKKINDTIETYIKRQEEKKDKRELLSSLNSILKASEHFAVGDIVYCSWGYEQTNIDFAQVVKVGKKSIICKPINSSVVGQEENGMSCEVVAVKDDFIEDKEEFTLFVKHCSYQVNKVELAAYKKYYYYSKYDGRPLYKSWYY